MANSLNHGLTRNTKKNTSSINNEVGGNVLGKSICSMLLMVPVSDKDFFQEGNNGKQMQKRLPEGWGMAALPKCQACRLESI